MRGHITRRKTKAGRAQLYIVYDVGWRWRDGVRRRQQRWEKVVPNTRHRAEALLAQRIGEVARGEHDRPVDIPFSELAKRYIDKDAAVRVRPRSLVTYRDQLRVHILPALGDVPVREVGLEAVQGFVAGKVEAGLSTTYVRALVSLIRAVLRKGAEWGYLPAPPLLRIRFPKPARPEVQPLTPDEVRRLLHFADRRWRPAYAMAILTGLRIGELLGARWRHIDFNRYEYRVTEQLKRDGSGFAPPKTAGSASTVFLSPELADILRAHQAAQAAEKLSAGHRYSDRDLIFAKPDGSSVPVQTFRATFERTLQAAGIARRRVHDLRHTCASLLLHQGESIKLVQRQMRHASVQQTLDVYGHLLPEANQEAAARLDAVLFAAV